MVRRNRQSRTRQPAVPGARATAASAWTGRPTIERTNPVPVRAILAAAGTLLAVALLISFRTPDDLPVTAGGRGPVQPTPAPTSPLIAAGGGATGGPGPVRSSGATPGATVAPSGRAAPAPTTPPVRSNPGGGATAPAATPRPPAPTPTPVPTPASGDVAGPIEQTPYGDVQVEVKVASGRIVDVVPIQLPSDRRRSAQISQYVAPILHDEALQAQSAQIDLISGATWTSGAYQASLQAALDKLANG